MTTVTTPSRTSTTDVARRAALGGLGGALWLLLPAAWIIAELAEQQAGILPRVAAAVVDVVFLVLAPALIVVGVTALRAVLGTTAGRAGRAGMLLAALGLGAMAVGNGIEVASMTMGGGEVAAGHAMFLLGFLVSIVGGVLLGTTVIRRRPGASARAGAWILVLALPLGIGVGMLASVLVPGNDAGFFAAISVPTGAAWVLLGRSRTVEDLATGRRA